MSCWKTDQYRYGMNLNPEPDSIVAEIPVTPADNCIQILIITNSYNFSKYLELRRKEKSDVSFTDLFKNQSGQIDIQIRD